MDLLTPLFFLFGAVYYMFGQRLFGHAPSWPLFLWGGYPMSAFSRFTIFSVFIAEALWKFARGFFDLKSSLTVVIASILCLIWLAVAYFQDRRRELARRLRIPPDGHPSVQHRS